MNCLQCSKETTNPKFCSRSCAATFNNKKQPKRRLEQRCKLCQELCTRERTYCQTCWKDLVHTRFINSLQHKTLNDLHSKRMYQINSVVRAYARRIYNKSTKPKCCTICNYSKHYEVCHIKAINSFAGTTLISEINSLDNLIALCPNCHWELDNGYLDI